MGLIATVERFQPKRVSWFTRLVRPDVTVEDLRLERRKSAFVLRWAGVLIIAGGLVLLLIGVVHPIRPR